MPVLKRGILALCGRCFDLRATYQAFLTQGNAFWACFHQKDPLEHCWYYREVGAALAPLAGCPAWQEYWRLFHELWPTQPVPKPDGKGGWSGVF